MAGPRPLVAPATVVPRQYGLLSAVQSRYEEPDAHWRNGVTYQHTCGLGGVTFDDYCVTGVGAPAKFANVTTSTRGATPFVPMVELDCSAPGYTTDEHIQRAYGAFLNVEEWQVERAFWTGTTAATGGYIAYPHLAANAQVLDGSLVMTTVLQTAATTVTGVALDIAEALGRLEAAHGDCAQGKGVIHMTPVVAEIAASRGLLVARNDRLWTIKGNQVVIGDGYPGTAPDGTSTAGAHWMYATGQIFAYRSTLDPVAPTFKEMFDRATNTAKIIMERTYVLGFGCCHFAIPVYLGGEISGAFNSAT